MFLHEIFSKTISIGVHTNDIKKPKHKFQNIFSMKGCFYIKVFWRSYQYGRTGMIIKK